jgi:hypothetical protein
LALISREINSTFFFEEAIFLAICQDKAVFPTDGLEQMTISVPLHNPPRALSIGMIYVGIVTWALSNFAMKSRPTSTDDGMLV